MSSLARGALARLWLKTTQEHENAMTINKKRSFDCAFCFELFLTKIFNRYDIPPKLLIIQRDLFDLGKVFQCFFACVFECCILVDIGGGYQDVVAIFEEVKATYSYECFITELFDICF